MRSADVLIVGGGPAGSSAARRLVQGGASVLVLDQARFPRDKLCAGWITPSVVADLQMDRASYPHGWVTFEKMQVHWAGLRLGVPTVQHSIRRCEFDAWLLERSGAAVAQHRVRAIAHDGDGYVIDGEFRGRYLIGAGGSSCPVYRALFLKAHPRAAALQVAALEQELNVGQADDRCHLWFFRGGLPGYAWYVPKGRGWVNVGLGGMSASLRRRRPLRQYWAEFADWLQRHLIPGVSLSPGGHTYHMRGDVAGVRLGNAFLAGDAAGLATRDMCEGIGPAVRAGHRAADAILHGTEYRLDDVTGSSLESGWLSRALEWSFAGGPYRGAGPEHRPR